MARAEKSYTTNEVAESMGVTIQTVRAWIHSGKMKAFRFGDGRGRWHVSESELNRIMHGGENHENS